MKATIGAVLLVLMIAVGGAHAEHVTPEELAIHQLQTQNMEEFSQRFKEFTKTDLDKALGKMVMWAAAAAVTVDFAEMNHKKPSLHDLHHCNGDMCFEQWAYNVGENKWGLQKEGQVTKLIYSNMFGNVEAVQYCYGYAGVVSCTADVANGQKLKTYKWFGLKSEQKGLVGQLYFVDDKDFIKP